MSGAFGNIKGIMFKSPELKTSKSGNAYAVATLKVKDGDTNKFWRVMGFKDAAPALMGFNDGDLVRAEGAIKIETYEKDGQTRVALSMLANSVEAPAQSNGERQTHRRPLASQAANGPNEDFRLRRHAGSGFHPNLNDAPF
jgi:single-stranded DNA-binding protein